MLEPLFDKVAGLQVSNFVTKRLQHMCFPVKFAKFLTAPILKNTCERLLLAIKLPWVHRCTVKKVTNDI